MAERRAVFAIPGDLSAPTGGYAYARRLLEELPARGWQVKHLPLGPGFPDIDAQAARAACAMLAAQPVGVPLIVDGLALGVLPDVGSALGARSPLVALVHHPLALESGLDAVRARALRESERAALSAAAVVVTSSHTTATTLRDEYAVPSDRLLVAVPGTDAAVFATGSGGERLHLLSVGSLVPRKGHDVLLQALAACRERPWALSVVGDDSRDPACARALRRLARDLGIASRVEFTGAVDRACLEALYSRADLFVLASRHEGFGMAGTEAVARGLPVVSTTAGAIPESLPPAAACLVAPDDIGALRDALASLMAEPARLRALALGARQAASGLAPWTQTAACVERALERSMGSA